MAKLPETTVRIIFDLQRQLLERIDEATATEAVIFEQFGENEETIAELEQLQKVRQRATTSYSPKRGDLAGSASFRGRKKYSPVKWFEAPAI